MRQSKADFSYHAALRGKPSSVLSLVRCAVRISTAKYDDAPHGLSPRSMPPLTPLCHDSSECIIKIRITLYSLEHCKFDLGTIWISLKRIFFPLAGPSRRVTYEQKWCRSLAIVCPLRLIKIDR